MRESYIGLKKLNPESVVLSKEDQFPTFNGMQMEEEQPPLEMSCVARMGSIHEASGLSATDKDKQRLLVMGSFAGWMNEQTSWWWRQ